MTEEETPLTREDALILLTEFTEILPELESGDADEETARHIRKLLESLERLPIPAHLREEQVREIKGWTELLLEESQDPEEGAGPGSTATLLRDRIQELHTLVDGGAEA